jgi:hypothetical protein
MLLMIQLHLECSCWFRHFCCSRTPPPPLTLQANDKKCIVMACGRFHVQKRHTKKFERFLVLPLSVRCCHTDENVTATLLRRVRRRRLSFLTTPTVGKELAPMVASKDFAKGFPFLPRIKVKLLQSLKSLLLLSPISRQL